ncbi:MAG TPA: BrnA antitoxin family protein [Candidatus Angelobacter sp.]
MKLTKNQAKQIRALKRMKDTDIDFSDIPEKTDWSGAVVGKFYRPLKKSLTIRIDSDVLAWVKGQGKGYQTRINRYLREAMHRGRKPPTKATGRKTGGPPSQLAKRRSIS